LGLLGELDEARSLASGLMTEFPDQRLDRLASVSQFQPEPTRRYVEGLKKAAMSDKTARMFTLNQVRVIEPRLPSGWANAATGMRQR